MTLQEQQIFVSRRPAFRHPAQPVVFKEQGSPSGRLRKCGGAQAGLSTETFASQGTGQMRVGSNLAGGAHDSTGRSDPAGTRVVWAVHSLRAEEGAGPGDTQLVRLDEGS